MIKIGQICYVAKNKENNKNLNHYIFQFPGIKGSIYGEESNKFTNTLGDSVVVEIQDTPVETRNLLSEVYHFSILL
jgi:hypothetical protein